MRPQTLVFVLVALIVAAGLAFFARSLMAPAPVPMGPRIIQKEEPAVQILVANDRIGTGEFIKPEKLGWRPWPKSALDERFITKDKFKESDVVGAVPRQPLDKGDPVFASKIIKPGQGGFLAAVLKPGMRAVSVNVNRATGNAGLVMPGDLVDLMLTQKIRSETGGSERFAGETVLRGLRVLAVDQTLDTKDQALIAQTATLEAAPRDAEKVLVAQQMGELSLVLRSLAVDADRDQSVDAAGPMWDREVSKAYRPVSAPAPAPVGAAPQIAHGSSVVVLRGGSGGQSGGAAPVSVPVQTPNVAAAAISPNASAQAPSQ